MMLESLASAMAGAAGRSALLLAVAAVIALLVRHAPAGLRHLVWAGALAGAAAMPLLTAALPTWSVPVATVAAVVVPAAAPVTATAPIAASPRRLSPAPLPAASPRRLSPASLPAASPRRLSQAPLPAAWPFRLFLIWTAGFVAVAVAFAVGVLRTHVVACQAEPVGDDSALAGEVERCAAELGLRRRVRVLQGGERVMPMTWGSLRPTILLPGDAARWPAARRRHVLLHELAHVRRADTLFLALATLACALYWFNPLVWVAAAGMRREQEYACDDEVLALGERPSDYAAHLLEIARTLRAPAMVAHAVAMARPSHLARRLAAVLAARRPRPARAGLVAWLLAAAVAVPLAAATPDVRVVTGEAVAASPRRLSPAPLPAASQDDCVPTAGSSRASTQSHSNDDDERTTITVRFGRCQIEVHILGRVTWNDDDTDVRTAAGGSIRVEQTGGGRDRRFEMRPGDRRWWLDGRAVPEDAEARAWLARALTTAFERTGYRIEARVQRALAQGGVPAVFALAERAGGDYARRRVLTILVDSQRLAPADVRRVLALAAPMGSDYEKAELLRALARRYTLDAESRAMVVEAAGTMGSDYERRRVLSLALATPGLPPAAAVDLLRGVERMGSDYERAEILITFVRTQSLAEAVQPAFFAAARGMGSDYERGRVLQAALAADAGVGVAALVVAAAGSIGSDYEHAQILTRVAARWGRDATVRPLLLRAAESIGSSHERERVMELLNRGN